MARGGKVKIVSGHSGMGAGHKSHMRHHKVGGHKGGHKGGRKK